MSPADLVTDVLICGGGFAGVAAAVAAARAGKRVILLERRTYLGAECFAYLRPWLTTGQFNDLCDLFGWSGDFATVVDGEFAVVPDRLKSALEDLLLDAGVTLLYTYRPVRLHRGRRLLVQAYGKAGSLRIETTTLVDATEQAVMARLACDATARPAQAGARVWRTIELTGVITARVDSPAIPFELTPACRTHPGHAVEHGHLLLEHAIDLVPGDDPVWQLDAELDVRPVSASICRWLKESQPAFESMKLAATSHELAVPPLWRVAPDQHDQIHVASPCGNFDEAEATALALNPAGLARLGASIGAQAAAATPRPAESCVIRSLPVEHRSVDVLVVGGGTSGVPAAIGAARQGCKALLADMNPGLGGTGTLGGVDSYWFGRRGGFNVEVAQLVADQQGWMEIHGHKWNTEAKALAWLSGARNAGVHPLLNTVLAEVRIRDDGSVGGALLASPECLIDVSATVTVDATGDGDVAVRAGAPYVYGSDREGTTMWYSLIPHIRPGVTRNNFTSTVNVGDPFDYTRAILSGRRRFPGHDHGTYIAPRESRHVLGGVRLTLTDILTMKRWSDVINVHFSNHDIKGQNCSDWLRMGLIPPNFEVEIPYRTVVPEQIDGVLVTGKAISATHDALPPIRMQADLENLGYVCGVAAGLSARNGVIPRHLPVMDLQTVLIREGLLPDDVLTRQILPAEKPSPEEMQQWIEALDDNDRLYNYGEVEMDDVRRTPIPMVQVCTAGPEIVPLLRAALANKALRGRLHIARALAWYGDTGGTSILLDAARAFLADDELPPRTAPIRYTQASPDHGAMPELAYLLHTLAMARDPAVIPMLMQVVERLWPTEAKFQDQMSGVFHYVDSICDIAERLGHPDCLPALRRLHGEPLFSHKQMTTLVQPDYFQERLAYLELTIARALARCGDEQGLRIMTSYLSDSRRMLANFASRELSAI